VNDGIQSYVGRKRCGCVVAALRDDPLMDRKQVAAIIGKWIEADLRVERMNGDEVRAEFMGEEECPHAIKQLSFAARMESRS
jgi:hypothetical protein